jgi:hypothetical protein
MTSRALAALLAATAVTATTGCGSAGHPPADMSPGPAGVAAAASASAPAAAPAQPRAVRPRRVVRHRAARPVASAPRPARHKAARATHATPDPTARRRDGTAQLAGAVLAQFGLPVASIAVSKRADAVTIAVPVKPACTATADDEAHILLVLRRLLPDASRIRIVVAPGTMTLGSFTRSRCPEIAFPTGPGAVVFDHGGAGSIRRIPVTITADRWTIAYDSRAASLHVLVRTRGGRAVGAILKDGRGPGQRTFRGPGRFVFSVRSPATWRIVVRDGAGA